MQQAIGAADKLEDIGYQTNIWSITSFTELEREALDCERWNRLHPEQEQKQSYVSQLFSEDSGTFIAVTDYMKSYATGIGPWLPGDYEVLGTDGYGMSESRSDLRDYFEISASLVIQAAISLLFRTGVIDSEALQKFESGEPNCDKTESQARG